MLEKKFCQTEAGLTAEGAVISGYASVFGQVDRGGDVVAAGAYKACLADLQRSGRPVRMLWQHDPAQPIGVWDELREDDHGLWVKGRLLDGVEKGREAAALIEAGAIDGLSIGYRCTKAVKDQSGRRILKEVDLWEVSLVTFPMLPTATVARKGEMADPNWRHVADAFREAAKAMHAG